MYTVFFFNSYENSEICPLSSYVQYKYIHTNIEAARREAPAGRLKWARHIPHVHCFLLYVYYNLPLCLELRVSPSAQVKLPGAFPRTFETDIIDT